MERTYHCAKIAKGTAEAEALVSKDAVCFYLVVPETGELIERISQNNLEKDEDYGKNQTANQKMRLQLIVEVYEFLHNALPFTNKTETLLRSVFLNRVYDVLAICGFPVLIHWSHLIRKCLALLCRKLGQLHSFLLQLFKIFVVII